MFEEYLELRDNNYHDGEQHYRGNSYKFSCVAWDALKAPIQTRAAVIRRVFDKLLSPGNIHKHNMATLENGLPTHCTLCGWHDTSSHASLRCNHPEQLDIRHHAYAQLDMYLHNLSAIEGYQRQFDFATALHAMILQHSKRWNIWLGLWNDHLLQDLEAVLPPIPNDVHLLNSYRKIAISITKILVSAVTKSTQLQTKALRNHLQHHKRGHTYLVPPTPTDPSQHSHHSTPSGTFSVPSHYPTPVSFDSAALSESLPSRASWPSQDSSASSALSTRASPRRRASIPTIRHIPSHIQTVIPSQQNSSTNTVHNKASLANKRRATTRGSSKKVARASQGPVSKLITTFFPPVPSQPNAHTAIITSRPGQTPVHAPPPYTAPELVAVQQSTAIT